MGRFSREPLFFGAPRGEQDREMAADSSRGSEVVDNIQPFVPYKMAQEPESAEQETGDHDAAETEPVAETEPDNTEAEKQATEGGENVSDGDAEGEATADSLIAELHGATHAAEKVEQDVKSEQDTPEEAVADGESDEHTDGEPEVEKSEEQQAEPEHEKASHEDAAPEAEEPDVVQDPVECEETAAPEVTPTFGDEYLGLPMIYIEDMPQEMQEEGDEISFLDGFF